MILSIGDVFSDFADSIIGFIFDPFKEVTDAINGVVTFFQQVIDLFGNMLDVFPTPFSSLIKLFLGILGVIFLYRLIKAGG